MLRDVSSFETWLREDLMDEMYEAINDGLLNNDPSSNSKAPLGLKTNAVQYTATPAYDESIENPNYIDDIIAVLALMRYNKEVPMVVWISSDVYYRIHHLKATDGKWLTITLSTLTMQVTYLSQVLPLSQLTRKMYHQLTY